MGGAREAIYMRINNATLSNNIGNIYISEIFSSFSSKWSGQAIDPDKSLDHMHQTILIQALLS